MCVGVLQCADVLRFVCYGWVGFVDLKDRVLVSSDDLAIFDIEAVVESDASENEVLLSFEDRVSDRLNPQAEFENVTCEKETVTQAWFAAG